MMIGVVVWTEDNKAIVPLIFERKGRTIDRSIERLHRDWKRAELSAGNGANSKESVIKQMEKLGWIYSKKAVWIYPE